MPGIKSYISTIFDGTGKSYIYLWASKLERVVYVGQTNERLGTLGRGFAHLQIDGTLRCRCLTRVGVDVKDLNDLTLLSYLLPQTPEFLGVETSYRLAVEYLVQTKLLERRGTVNPVFRIVSNVLPTARTRNSDVIALLEEIVADFLVYYAKM